MGILLLGGGGQCVACAHGRLFLLVGLVQAGSSSSVLRIEGLVFSWFSHCSPLSFSLFILMLHLLRDTAWDLCWNCLAPSPRPRTSIHHAAISDLPIHLVVAFSMNILPLPVPYYRHIPAFTWHFSSAKNNKSSLPVPCVSVGTFILFSCLYALPWTARPATFSSASLNIATYPLYACTCFLPLFLLGMEEVGGLAVLPVQWLKNSGNISLLQKNTYISKSSSPTSTPTSTYLLYLCLMGQCAIPPLPSCLQADICRKVYGAVV